MPIAPQVSVAIIAYQQKAYIADAIRSAADQDYPNLQVVVSDDHSTDGTAEEIVRVAELYPDRVVALLNSDRVGLTPNCNRALAACTGEYVCFMGGDDLLLPGKISRQVAWFEERRERVLCAHQAEVFYQDGSRSAHDFDRPLKTGRGAGDIIRNGPFCACSVMVRTDRIPAHGFDERVPIVSDFMLWVDVLRDDGEFGFVPGTYARYRRHDSNISADIAALARDTDGALELIERCYPQYAKECRLSRARKVDYSLGVQLLREGQRKAAREAFLGAIRLDPTFPKPWVRLMQTFGPA